MGTSYRTWVEVGKESYDDVLSYVEMNEPQKHTRYMKYVGSKPTPLSRGFGNLSNFLFTNNSDKKYTKFNPAEDKDFMRALIQTSKAFPDVPIKLKVAGEFSYDKWTLVKHSVYKDGEEFPVGKYDAPKDEQPPEPTYKWKPVNIGENKLTMNKPKMKKLIEAAKESKPVDVQKIVNSLLAEKVKALIAETKKNLIVK